ncbi:hypothetical protein K435DRAFT_696155, partial [Dendrothele bispora CBS 962.96]
LRFRHAIESYVAKDRELRKYELSEADWKSLMLITEWLKTFRCATTEMSTTKHPMLSKTLAIFRGLQDKIHSILSELPHSADPSLRRGLIDAHCWHTRFYCTEMTPVM